MTNLNRSYPLGYEPRPVHFSWRFAGIGAFVANPHNNSNFIYAVIALKSSPLQFCCNFTLNCGT